MTTSAKAGKAGRVQVGATVTEVTGWTLDRTTDALDATSMASSGNREFIDGLFGWTGTFTSLTFINKTGSQASATFDVLAGTPAATTPRFSGAIIITNEPVACEVGGVVQYAYTFTGTGACTAATA
jgi:hypothetical protein